jgi:hypothetical protein
MDFHERQRTSSGTSALLNITDIRLPDYAYKRGISGVTGIRRGTLDDWTRTLQDG